MLFLKKRKDKEEPIQNQSANIDGQIQVAVDQLKSVVEQMTIATIALEETSATSKEKTEILLDHSEHTAQNTTLVAKKMSEIEASALHISAFSQEILSNSQTSNEELIISFDAFQSLQKKFETLQTSHHTLLEQMNELVSNSKKIHDIVHTIGSISQKTKMLALNAAIEAARAGAHGKGFAVVANEVGNLAHQTTNAVDETRENINLILNEINKVTTMVKSETKQIEHGTIELNEVLQYLKSFKGKLHLITEMVSDSTNFVDEQRENVQEIAQLLEEISVMAVKNKENVSLVTDELDHQHVNVEDIQKISQLLINTSDELQTIVHKEVTTIELDQVLLNNVKSVLANIVQSGRLVSMDSNEHKKILDDALSSYPHLEAIWSNRLDGTFVYSNPKAGLVNAKMRPWFVHASTGQVYVSEVYISALTKNNCISLSMPIQEGQQIIGVLGADLSLD